jgi:5-methylcytosine-specific restriction protein A
MKRTALTRRTPLVAKTELKRKTPLPKPGLASVVHAANGRESKPRRRPRDTKPSAKVVALVWARDGGCCFCCGAGLLFAQRGVGWSMQHRRARGMGGSRRPDTNEPQNLILLCGSATSPGGCHARVESRLLRDGGMGWSIKQAQNPLLSPVMHWRLGYAWLTVDGRMSTTPPTIVEEAS